MKHLRMKPFEPFCFLYSAAMILDAEPNDLITEIGHTGWDVWWPNSVNTERNFHIEEIQDCCRARGKALVFVDPNPHLNNNNLEQRPIWSYSYSQTRFLKMFDNHRGIVRVGTHAMAVKEDGVVFDPRGGIIENIGVVGGITGGWVLYKIT